MKVILQIQRTNKGTIPATWPLLLSLLYILLNCHHLHAHQQNALKYNLLSDNLTLLNINQNSSLILHGPDGSFLVGLREESFRQELKNALDKLPPMKYLSHADIKPAEHFRQYGTVLIESGNRQKTLTADSMDSKTQVIDHLFLKPPPIMSINFEGSLTLYLNGEEVRLLQSPFSSSSKQDYFVWFKKNNVIALGPFFEEFRFPTVKHKDKGSVMDTIKSLEYVLGLIDKRTKIISYKGNGSLSSKRALEKYLQLCRDSIAYVRSKIRKGISLELIRKQGLPRKYQHLVGKKNDMKMNGDRWINQIYHSLKQEEYL